MTLLIHIRNVEDDLINSAALTLEQIYVDKENLTIKVIAPRVEESEILEILNRHKPIA